MNGTTHALVGALVGTLVRRPGAALIAGVASHAVLDVIPHRDDLEGPTLILDGCGALAVLACTLLLGRAGATDGVLGGVLPDLENIPDIIQGPQRAGNGRKVFPSHWWEHGSVTGRHGNRIQACVAVAAAIGLAAAFLSNGDGRCDERYD